MGSVSPRWPFPEAASELRPRRREVPSATLSLSSSGLARKTEAGADPDCGTARSGRWAPRRNRRLCRTHGPLAQATVASASSADRPTD
jgi:hypothetical protein